MFGTTQTHNLGAIDPNTQRVLVELANVIGDVEQRIQMVKVGLTQAFPQIAPYVQARGLGQLGLGAPIGIGQPFGAPVSAPFFGGATPYGPQLPTLPLGLGFAPGLAPATPFAPPTGLGVGASFRY